MGPRGTIIGILGLWMIIAGIVGLGLGGNHWNDWIVGAIVATLGFYMSGTAPLQGLLSGALGLWLIVSTFIPGLRAGPGARFDDLFVGVVLAFAGFSMPPRKSGGAPSKRRAA
jgi:hypothetical protein